MITKKQKEVLDFISEYLSKNQMAPSLEEIAKHFKLNSVSTAHHHVEALEHQGYIRRKENHPRALDLVDLSSAKRKENIPRQSSLTQLMNKNFTEENFPENKIICGDVIETLSRLPDKSIDLILADPPYNLSQGNKWSWEGDSNLTGFGGKWSKVMESWDNKPLIDYFTFTCVWLKEVKRILKPTGSIWIFGTYHNIGAINMAFQILEIEIINEIIWYKRNAFPNLSGRRFTASHETLLWGHTSGKKRKYFFDYQASKDWGDSSDLMKAKGKQMRTVWDIPNNKESRELKFGKHPTQKPLSVCKRVIALSTKKGDVVLSPFAGVGSECLAAKELGRKYIGIELDEKYVEIAKARLSASSTNHSLF